MLQTFAESGFMDFQTLCTDALTSLIAPWVQRLTLEVVHAEVGEVHLRLPMTAEISREGGMLCGQATMAAADTAMVLAACTQLGGFKPMTTVSLNTSFLRAATGSHVTVIARVLKPGKTLLFGEIEVLGADGKLVAHATTTYAVLA
jgi:uncharacterized protein (TIGR00369 family)